MEHLMLDIETMGSISYSSIVSIGAIKFDINTGETGDTFYVNIDLQDCIDNGLVISGGTIMWWLQQNEEARQKLTENPLSLVVALRKFKVFCGEEYQIWGNSARFDCGILQNAYNKLGMTIPWDFRKERCLRTLVSFKPNIKDSYKFDGVLHDALDDCRRQIGYCCEIWKELNN